MAIVKVHNKDQNITYVYESVSYWDKDLKQPRSHRKLIGRLDPATGEVIPTGKRTKATPTSGSHSDTDYKALYERVLVTIDQKDALILGLRTQLATAEKEIRSCRHSIKKACDTLTDTASGKERINE